MATVLVTGGAGYIGAHACRALAAAGHLPVCFDDFRTGWRDAVRFGPLVEGGLLDRAALDAAFATHRPEAVMHFAALSLVAESVAHPERYWRNNVGGTLNLLEAMRDAGVRRLVFSSTAAVYGEPDLALIPEHAPQRPTNPYGATKLAVERMIGDVGAAHGLRAVVFRYFNVAGAAADAEIGEQHRPETHLIPLVLDAALGRREAITMNGDDYPTPDGACVRDYLHVEDLADAHLLGLERLLSGGESLTVNLGVGRGYSVREVIERARAVTGRPIHARLGPRRAGDPARLVCDPSQALTDLGWRATRSNLDQMIADAWVWAQGPGYES
ncbi:MAG: UDP-glucose 4-epimerase GalE [Rhodobacteraceae bacterium]|nr:MAG: UDP-glucose 4-epimerase GalE [Paracoccaceae bacterium]